MPNLFYKHKNQKRNFDFIHKSCQYFCFDMFNLTTPFLSINKRDINSIILIIRTWLFCSSVKCSGFPHSVVGLWAVGKSCQYGHHIHNFCYRHYAVKHTLQRKGSVNSFVYLWTAAKYTDVQLHSPVGEGGGYVPLGVGNRSFDLNFLVNFEISPSSLVPVLRMWCASHCHLQSRIYTSLYY